ncbi:hypothetical protein ACX1C1_07325 [Paenibacillus sp. strain BS8-2]
MGVKYYLVHGVNLSLKINNIIDYHKRKDLVEVPSVLRYTLINNNEFGISVYNNELNSYIIIQFIDEFASTDMALEHYNSQNIFDQNYENGVTFFRRNIATIEHYDWSMLWVINEGLENEINVEHGKVFTKRDGDNELFAMLDACFIYQSSKQLQNLLNNLNKRRTLGRKYQKLLSYYSSELFKLSKPKYFLTYELEINTMNKYYKAWEIGELIDELKQKFNQEVTNYSFLWDYNNSIFQKRLNYILMYIAIVSACPPLREFIKAYSLDGFEMVPFYILFGSTTIFVFYILTMIVKHIVNILINLTDINSLIPKSSVKKKDSFRSRG